MRKARVLKFFLHLFNTYGIKRHAWYLLIIRLSFVSPNYHHLIISEKKVQAFRPLPKTAYFLQQAF